MRGLERCGLVLHVAACDAGTVARLFEAHVGVSVYVEAAFRTLGFNNVSASNKASSSVAVMSMG